MESTIQPSRFVAIRLPSETVKVQQIIPNTTISLGKYGSFPANQIIGRPYYLTFEILDKPEQDPPGVSVGISDNAIKSNGSSDKHILRIVSAAELHTESLMLDGGSAPDEVDEGDDGTTSASPLGGTPAPLDTEERNNRETFDNPSTQSMTVEEIEKLKQGMSQAGQAIINQLLESHAALDRKTAFSLAKYKLRKRKKYLRRFTVEPLDVSNLTNWMLLQKDPSRILELNDEMLGLIGCWANVHNGGDAFGGLDGHAPSLPHMGRWLVVDDTGGLIVAAMAERMGILHTGTAGTHNQLGETSEVQAAAPKPSFASGMSSTNTTLTLIHPNAQPNLSLLKYFGFDNTNPNETHPLHANLKALSWMQLLSPESDPIYANEPPVMPDDVLAAWKPSKRGLYHRKRRRWQRVHAVVDEVRRGEYDGLIVASLMDPVSVLRHTVPLLAGSAHVVVYSPNVEAMTRLSDLYSSARRSAYLALWQREQEPGAEVPVSTTQDEDFPLDPTLLFGATVQTSRARAFQVLPGRTHPTMTARGGAVGYIFHAVRGLAAEGKVTARGQVARKKRKTESDTVEAPDPS